MFTGIVTDVGEITALTPGGQKGDRRFVVRTVGGQNDVASMHEVVTRRFRRYLDERAEAPELGTDLGQDGSEGPMLSIGHDRVTRARTGAAATADNRREFFAGVNVPFGADTLWLGAGTSKTESVAGSTASQFSVGYIHSVAKGVDVYGVLTDIKNGSATAYSDDTATGAGPAVSAGKSASAAQVGFRYRF